MNYKQDMLNMIEQLESSGANITSKNFQSYLLKTVNLIRREETDGVLYPLEFRDFYPQINGMLFSWESDKDSNLIGQFYLETFGRAFLNSAEIGEGKLWVDHYQEDDIAEMKTHGLFEPLLGLDEYITIKLFPERQYKMYYVDGDRIDGGGSKDLPVIPLTIEQYFKVNIGCYGLTAVRRHLHKDEFYTKPFDVCPELRSLEKLFPNFQPPVL